MRVLKTSTLTLASLCAMALVLPMASSASDFSAADDEPFVMDASTTGDAMLDFSLGGDFEMPPDLPTCNSELNAQLQSLKTPAYMLCTYVMSDFGTCDDKCLTTLQSAAKSAPACEEPRSISDDHPREQAKRCEKVRAKSATKYIPKHTTGGSECVYDVYSKWQSAYLGLGYTLCQINTLGLNAKCPDDCLKTIEKAVDAAPLCLTKGDYSVREYQKRDLITCLRARGDDLTKNAILQSTVSATPSKDTSAKAPTAKSSSALSTTMPAPCGVVVGTVVTAMLLAVGF